MLHFKIVVASLCVVSVCASGYGGNGVAKSGGYGGGYGGGLGLSAGYGGGRAAVSAGLPQVVAAAVHTKHNIEYRDVPSSGSVTPTTIEVGSNSIPLQILFRSASSHMNIQQAHDGAGGDVHESTSEDEPHKLFHTVRKPIIQEVLEVITPFRKITQEIQPVQEEIQTIVARGNGQGATVNGGFGFGGGAAFNGRSAGAGGYGGGMAKKTLLASKGGY